MTLTLNIGQAAAAAGVSAKMIRHYERIGLLPSAARTEAGYRRYGAREVSLLRFIRQARRLGFSMPQIAGLVDLWSDRTRASRDVKALAQAQLAELEQRVAELEQMRQALARLVAACSGDDDPHCAILDELGAVGEAPPAPGAAAARPNGAPARRARPGPHHDELARAGTSTAIHDLMAWTQQLHAGPGGSQVAEGGRAPREHGR